VDRQQGLLIWQLPSIDSSNPSGSLEFNCEGEDTESFFPVTVQFESERLICDVDVSTLSGFPLGDNPCISASCYSCGILSIFSLLRSSPSHRSRMDPACLFRNRAS
jgi:hypothetical protein